MDRLSAALDWLWRADNLTAVSTLAIAFFTIVLAWTSYCQARLIRRSIDLARDEFNSSHRPRIVVRDVWCEPPGNISYMLFNTGDTTARVVESWVLAEFIPSNQAIRPLRSAGHNDLGQIRFAAGEMKDLTYSAPSEVSAYMLVPDMMRIATEDRGPMVGDFYFTGAILYADDAGNLRRSVFRRRWDKDRKCFVRLDDSDQEYAD